MGQLAGAALLVLAAFVILAALTGWLLLVALAAVGMMADNTLKSIRLFARAQQRITLRRFN